MIWENLILHHFIAGELTAVSKHILKFFGLWWIIRIGAYSHISENFILQIHFSVGICGCYDACYTFWMRINDSLYKSLKRNANIFITLPLDVYTFFERLWKEVYKMLHIFPCCMCVFFKLNRNPTDTNHELSFQLSTETNENGWYEFFMICSHFGII